MPDINSNSAALRTGGQVVVDTLRANGVKMAFCLPGESFLAVLDAMLDVQDELQLIVCRHEASAANMATAYGKLTGTPGICFVTRGPGASHAAIGVHTAAQDSAPMILFVGQVERAGMERDSFQEIDYVQMFGKTAKWAAQIEDASRIPEFVNRAFHVAVNGRPGPVVLALPEDVLTDLCEVAALRPFNLAEAAPSPTALRSLETLLSDAATPLLVLGGGGWTEQACRDVQVFAERFKLPVATGFRCQDLFDNRHPNYVGELGLGTDPILSQYVRRSDLIIALGERLGEATTKGYTLLPVPQLPQLLIQIHPEPGELSRIYQADLLINASMPAFAQAVRGLSPAGPLDGRDEWIAQGRSHYQRRITPPQNDAKLNIGKVVSQLREMVPSDAIVTNGAGNYAGYVTRFHQFSVPRTQLAPVSGAMGFGFPAAIVAQLLHPGRVVVCFAGDGCFLMSSQEMATLARYKLPVITVIINNGSYGSIRLHQERQYPGRVFGTDLENPDFVALAAAYGIHAESIETTAEFEPAFQRALAARRPTIIELWTDTTAMITYNPRR